MLLSRVLSISACFFCAVSLYAQVDTGTILGTVHDNTGAVIAGAKVTVRDEGTSRSQTNTTPPLANMFSRLSRSEGTPSKSKTPASRKSAAPA